jgi:hypothetical protein
VTKFGRARRENILRHPDSERVTRRIPFLQLRDMVMALIEDDEPSYSNSVQAEIRELDDAVREFDETVSPSEIAREFDAAPTTYRPAPRLDTIDALIDALPKH